MPFYYDFSKPHNNAFLRFVRHIYRPLHFEKGYNFPLWVIFGGAIFGFGCARVMYFDFDGIFARTKIINGDWELYRAGYQRIGAILHLAGVIPACFLVPWQFLPIIRHAAMWFHRINGYLLVILLLIGNAGALMISRRSSGGDPSTQTLFGILIVWTTFGVFMAYWNIKRLQIDQHRAWMLRTWFVAAAVISQRIILMAAGQIISAIGDYYVPMACHTITFITTQIAGRDLATRYATCREDPVNGYAAVNASLNGTPDEIGAVLISAFTLSGMVAVVLHAVGIELYLALTTAERDRLKQVSYEKQLARGWRRPGDASFLTPTMWGDNVPWYPQVKSKDSGGEMSEEESIMV